MAPFERRLEIEERTADEWCAMDPENATIRDVLGDADFLRLMRAKFRVDWQGDPDPDRATIEELMLKVEAAR